MNKHVNSVAARLSLRQPQRESLEILAEIMETIDIAKHDADSLKNQLEKVKSIYPSVEDFERDFPSLCFALATGVGKTRLMGAFISYLYIAKKMKNFFVLAPNLTIYNKLIEDFTPNTPKYVFKGIAEFAVNPPIIITGENYEEGIGVRRNSIFGEEEVHINIFNISKINSEVRGGNSPRIKRLQEYIGESYFEYLSSLPDLVLLMDESHRYRASAGVKVLNELKPVLGIELTATPQVESGSRTIPFKNVIYSYPLHKAMQDGFVKEPAVATRENFNASEYNEEQLERIKLEDGILVHEETKVELEVYARQNQKPYVKPFVLIVAQDTGHAEQLMNIIESNSFFDGCYKGKVITVHSNQRGEEKDETVQQLMSVEQPDNEIEIVIHVNMLKEGWDVTNLYTIIPLRAANSKTLVEQSIGRGLRLPYGKRTGVRAVDQLTIIAHDRFQEIVDEANNPNSIIRTGVVIGRDVGKEKKRVITTEPAFLTTLIGQTDTPDINQTGDVEEVVETGTTPSNESSVSPLFTNPIQRDIAIKTYEMIKKYEYLPNSQSLLDEEVEKQIMRDVKKLYKAEQIEMFEEEQEQVIRETVSQTLQQVVQHTLDIPRIIIQPKGELSWGYHDFDLDVSGINLQPVNEAILIQELRTNHRERLHKYMNRSKEERLENLLVSELMNYSDISYDDNAELLYKLAGQVVEHFRSYLASDEEVENVLFYNQSRLASLIHAQMKEEGHYYEMATDYEVIVRKGFETLKTETYSASQEEGTRNFRQPVENKKDIRSMVFTGFQRCLYTKQKFDSDSERRFAVICESDPEVEKWFKPTPGQLKIYYSNGNVYHPDFVVETKTKKYICEIKKEKEITDSIVQQKAQAVVQWCKYATEHALQNDGKPWEYLLIPHTDVNENMTLQGLVSRYRKQ